MRTLLSPVRVRLPEESCETMPTRKKIPFILKAVLFLVVSSGTFALAGCSPPSLVQDATDQPAIIPTPLTSPIQTPIRDTETATLSPTGDMPTATWTSRPSLASSDESILFQETFSDNQNNWHTDATLVTIVAGKYSHRMDCPDSKVSLSCGKFIKMPFTFPKNFRMEMDATLTKFSTGANVIVAFQVRRSDFEYYFVKYFITKGYYQMSYISEYDTADMIPETSTDLLKMAVGDTNRLGIEVKDMFLKPLLNEREIAPIQDRAIPSAGDSYLVILINRGYSAELQLDNLLVQEAK